MSSFDPMAAAIDWLDAYRAANLDQLVDLYAQDAALECGSTTVIGREAISAYWRNRFERKPAGELDDLLEAGDLVVVSYKVPSGLCRTTISFNETGKISRCHCAIA